jgi:hypothetical protein
MEEYELWLLAAFALVVVAKVLQQLAALCARVRVPPRVPPRGADAVQAARDAAEWALYAKEGRAPGCKRLGLTLSLLAAVTACVPVWWRLTEARRQAFARTAACPWRSRLTHAAGAHAVNSGVPRAAAIRRAGERGPRPAAGADAAAARAARP